MVTLIHILTILFAIGSLIIIKQKRYKVMPFICSIIFISFIGCGSISVVALAVPYGEILVYPLAVLILGLIFILVGINDVYSLVRCKEKIEGVYCGYNTYYGGNGISTQSPVFKYTYNGIFYHEQTTQNISYKHLTRNMREGKIYNIYIDPRHPAVFIFSKKIKAGSIIAMMFGILFFVSGIAALFVFFPVFWNVIK